MMCQMQGKLNKMRKFETSSRILKTCFNNVYLLENVKSTDIRTYSEYIVQLKVCNRYNLLTVGKVKNYAKQNLIIWQKYDAKHKTRQKTSYAVNR